MYSLILLSIFSCLLVKCLSNNYILCTNSQCSQITVSFLQPRMLPVECEHNNTITSASDNARTCVIDYRIDYDAENVYIKFKATNDTNILRYENQSELLIQTIWLGFNHMIPQPNLTHRTYACNNKDDCARQFYFDTIEYLTTHGKKQLGRIRSKLYKESTPTNRFLRRRCIVRNTYGNISFLRCGDGLCYANTLDKRQYCSRETIPTFFSEIEYHVPKVSLNERELIEYRCNKHLCNKNDVIESIRKIVHEYTNLIHGHMEEQQINRKSFAVQNTFSFIIIILSLIVHLHFSM